MRTHLGTLGRIGLIYNSHPIMPNGRTERDSVLESWKAAGKWFISEADKVKRKLDVSVVSVDDPYISSEDQSKDILAGRFMVSSLNCDHPIFSQEENISFRIWHDVVGHHEIRGGFDTDGELDVLRYSLQHSPTAFRGVLLVETLSQLAFAHINNGFGDQKCFDAIELERIWNGN